MDTRTAPRPARGRSQAIEEPITNAVKVPSDPAQVIVNHASFRVRLAEPARQAGAVRRHVSALGQTAIVPTSVRSSTGSFVPVETLGGGVSPQRPDVPGQARRGAPVVWTGKTDPHDAAATQLLDAVQTAATRLVPRVGDGPAGPAGSADLAGPAGGKHGPGYSGAGAGEHLGDGIGAGSREGDGYGPEGGVLRGGAHRSEDHAGSGYDSADGEGAGDATRLQPAARPYIISPRAAVAADLVGHTLNGQDGEDGRLESPSVDVPFDGGHRDAHEDVYGEAHGDTAYGDGEVDDLDDLDAESSKANSPARHPYHPGRRRGSGLMLLPLRLFLGGISVYAGMSKLCDPDFFNGGDRGSMARWLSSLHPWAVAEPLRDLALSHPVGSGLTVAFLQIAVGMLTAVGLWQRAAAGTGMLLSAALLVTVSWHSAPAYDVPDIIYLAAWSPLLFAGASAYSLDTRLANDAWRTLGPRCSAFDMRRWILRRGVVVATVIMGLTLLVGSALGGAVRAGSFRTTVPDPSSPPTNHLPGQPLPTGPDEAGDRGRSGEPGGARRESPSASPSSPSHTTQPTSQPPAEGGTLGGSTGGQQPNQGGNGSTVTQQPSTPGQPQQPDESPSRGGGALGGILGAGGLMGEEPSRPTASA